MQIIRPQIVIDTNVVIAALYSRTGTSFSLLNKAGRGEFDLHLSTSLAIEYEEVMKRDPRQRGIPETVVDDILDYLCAVAHEQLIFYLWRPFLPDPDDDLILELAVAARCSHIVTHNLRHFRDVEKTFGIRPVTPIQFLRIIGAAT